MILTLDGTVTTGDAYRVSTSDDTPPGYIHIGEKDLLHEIDAVTWNGPVTIAWADSRFTGDLHYDLGCGYSEHTPLAADELKISGHNILDLLTELQGQHVTVWVADEPVNVLDTGAEPPDRQPTRHIEATIEIFDGRTATKVSRTAIPFQDGNTAAATANAIIAALTDLAVHYNEPDLARIVDAAAREWWQIHADRASRAQAAAQCLRDRYREQANLARENREGNDHA